MSLIKTFLFEQGILSQMGEFSLLKDWPVVYVLENTKEVYIGQTTSLHSRSKSHLANPLKTPLNQMHVILDEEFNVSAALDTESQLIQYFAAEGSMRVQNGNRGLVDHSYFDKERYRAKFEATVWKALQEKGLVSKELADIRNSEIFKYSPYKALTEDQVQVASSLVSAIKEGVQRTHIVKGGPGTGKSVLATYLVKALKEDKETAHLRVALVVPMSGLRKSLQNAFSYVEGLSKDMVIGPSEVVREKYDLLIIDEAHRLRQRRNIVNYQAHDQANAALGLGNEGTELDWVLQSSDHQILFYDSDQMVRPADVDMDRFSALNAATYQLTNQHRVTGGENYIEFIEKALSGQKAQKTFDNYDFRIFENLAPMLEEIKSQNNQFGLSRVVAGFAWKWISKQDSTLYDIELEGLKLRWNSRLTDWVNSPNAMNEVGCIHTVQGYDLNYIGIIVGPELSYDETAGKLIAKREHYKDQNGLNGTTPEELERYILNIYKTLMTRGIKGCYLYFVDKSVERYFKKQLENLVVEPEATK